jgi:hypothetical protein
MSAEITAWLDHPLPMPVRFAVAIPGLALAAWVFTRHVAGHRVWRYALHPHTRPATPPTRWAVHCAQCGDLDPPLANAADALDVGWLHLALNTNHALSIREHTTTKETA